MGKLASFKHPVFFKNLWIKKYITHFDVNMTEAIKTNYEHYECFNDFFSRRLQPLARPIDQDSNSIISPADGSISMLGKIHKNTLIQAKNHDYTVQDLLGGNFADAEKFINGHFMTIYLSPKDYHRVHTPVTGKLVKTVHIPGKLFSVNPLTVESVPNLFACNERTLNIFETDIGNVAVIFVGAIIVGSIVMLAKENDLLNKGDELGYFQMGSTVIVLFQENKISFENSLTVNSSLKMGTKIGNSP